MVVAPQLAWKLVLAIALCAAIVVSGRARAPRGALPGRDLSRLAIAALGLYAVGALAWLTRHPLLAGIVYAAGIATAALAAWLSRGGHRDDPPDPGSPAAEPPPNPGGWGRFDWASFELDFRAYASREQEPAERH
jgi:hypothetical protein